LRGEPATRSLITFPFYLTAVLVFTGHLKCRRGRGTTSGSFTDTFVTQPPTQKKFVCQQCTNSYHQRSHLYRHEMNVHGEHAVPSECHICARVYKNRDSLRRHLNLRHKGKRMKIRESAIENVNNAIDASFVILGL
jgi:hypothetical protein